ncbi:MAG TPA: amino acid transporter, partial [Thermoanaerobaculia bacterium]|nr:amino acid transporter [Thermoanaerobaculia bacterium]
MSLAALFRKKPIAEIERDAELGFADEPGPVSGEPHLRRSLGVIDHTAFGIAAIIGAGIFSAIANACFYGGPAV